MASYLLDPSSSGCCSNNAQHTASGLTKRAAGWDRIAFWIAEASRGPRHNERVDWTAESHGPIVTLLATLRTATTPYQRTGNPLGIHWLATVHQLVYAPTRFHRHRHMTHSRKRKMKRDGVRSFGVTVSESERALDVQRCDATDSISLSASLKLSLEIIKRCTERREKA